MIDLFCGTGGFAHGFLQAEKNLNLVYGIDFDNEAAATAKANHVNTIIDHEDIRKIDLKDLSKRIGLNTVDLIIGGPPCQGFSSLRPHRSKKDDDERNDLYSEFLRFVKYFSPKVVVLENVVGLITHKGGSTLDQILEKFTHAKYNVEWRILNAASFGVPQKRERFILIASKDNGPVDFPVPTFGFSGKVVGHNDKSRLMIASKSSPKALSVNHAISDLPFLKRGENKKVYDKDPQNEYQRQRRSGAKALTLHKATNHSDKMLEIIKHSGSNISSIPAHLITSGFSSCYSRLEGDEPSTTITVKFQSPSSSKCIHPQQNRALTPREAARIQSFDDTYIFKGSLTKVASQIGNAVPPILGRQLASVISKLIK